MYLPDQLQHQSFMTWNHTVKGLMRLWEIAQKLGLEKSLEQRLQEDPDGTAALRLGALGNDPRRLANVYRQCLQATTHANVPLPFYEAPRPGFLNLSAQAWRDDPETDPQPSEDALPNQALVNVLQSCCR